MRCDFPTGKEMFDKTKKVKDMVEEVYIKYPSTRGDERLLVWRFLRMFCPQVKLTFSQFEALRSIPSFETIRRRGQELRHDKPQYQPTERVQKKRFRRSEAFRHYYGDGGLKLTDYLLLEGQI